jgi:hypothetical protein
MKERGDETRTDAEGRFVLEQVPKEGLVLGVGADAVIPRDVDIAADANPEDFVVYLYVRCHVQVELDEPLDRADSFGFEDEDGESVDVMIFRQGTTNAYTSMPLAEGRSAVVSVSSKARTLVLFKNESAVARIPLDLVPDEVNVVRF